MADRVRQARLADFRAQSFQLLGELRVTSLEEAVAFVERRGFVYFWPIKDILLPSLWVAVAGDRPVASKHDDPGHVTWGWKDRMLDQRRWYYAKILRGKATLVSLEVAPNFYALSENYGDPEGDYLVQYQEGRLSQAARAIYERLLTDGPLDTVTLRRKIRMTGKASNSPFERGLVELQRDFKILPVGVAETGAWRYSFLYDLVSRYYPELSEQARRIRERDARRLLVELYFKSVGAAREADVRRVFQWQPNLVRETLTALVQDGRLLEGCLLEGDSDPHYCLPNLL